MFRISRIGCCLLAVSFLISALVSCSQIDDTNAAPASYATDRRTNEPSFEDADFNGASFIICSPMDNARDFGDRYIDNDDLNGEPINDAVIKRNQIAEGKYNIDISQRNEGSGYALQASRSGTVDFDLVYDWGIRLVPAAMDGAYYDLNRLDALDLSQDYWAPTAQEQLTIAGKMLITTCDISMNRIGYAYFYLFNKDILDDLKLTYPYEYVNENIWTYDKLIEMFTQISADSNGDTIWGAEDLYGISDFSPSNVIEGAGLKKNLTQKNDDGSYSLNIYSEKLVQIYEKYRRIQNDPSVCPDYIDWAKDRDISMYDSIYQARRVISFAEGHVAFKGTTMSYIPELIEAGADLKFGIVPNPKYTSSQSGYYHMIDVCAPMFSVPKQAPDLKRTGIILEFLAYQSKQTLLPAFYEETIKTKCMSDPEGRDEQMLNIIRDSVYYRWTSLYYQGILDSKGNGWDPCGTILSEMLAEGNFNSILKKYKYAAQKSIDDFYNKILLLDSDK